MNNKESLNIELLRELTQAFGPSGDEKEIADLIESNITQSNCHFRRDNLGNLIVTKQGRDHEKAKKIMICAHMDEIGLIVTHIDDQGFIRFAPIGGIKAADCLYQRVQFRNGVVGVIAREKEVEKNQESKLSKYYIDIGQLSKEQAKEVVHIGDKAVFSGEFQVCGGRYLSKAFDNRIGCFVVLEVLQQITTDHELIVVFSAQEEVGARGARVASYLHNPDLAINIDTTIAEDIPKHTNVTISLGNGVCIKVLDRSIIVSPMIKNWIAETAETHQIDFQWEILERGGTDSGPIHTTKSGILTGALSIPVKYLHTPSEMIAISDVKGTINLLLQLLNNADSLFKEVATDE